MQFKNRLNTVKIDHNSASIPNDVLYAIVFKSKAVFSVQSKINKHTNKHTHKQINTQTNTHI